ncbi:MAG: F0F1 ATP synthase subunit alpha [Bacilli bacterium]|nr:F0F1 ATP synthase subunit alpha [Bacilli bacterium]
MKIKSNEISSLIKEEIRHFSRAIESNDVGTVISVGDGIALVYGLDHAMLGELLLFPHDIYGMVMNLESEHVGVALFGNDRLIKEGDTVKRTKKVTEVPVGDELLGRVVNALGTPLDNGPSIKSKKYRPIERIAPNVMKRKKVDTPLETGIKAIDAMIPIGRGQRELIIGDRQTGKTAIAIDAIINQHGKNVKCVYVAIGQKNSSVASIYDKLKQYHALDYTVVVNASASELAPLQYIAPYSAMAMAEEWLEKGEDVLIVFDDLSKHAVAYRALSLLLKRPPGREAYPGDVFYLHSRLLERACKLDKKYGGGSITALPIVETQAGDISSYIPTNIISITDGQIFLVTDYFNAGLRPAIDTGFSVSRVGSDAQFKMMKQVAKSLKIELANYREMLSFSQFGSDLDKETKKILKHGAILTEMHRQDHYSPYSVTRQVIEIYATKNGYFDEIEPKKLLGILNDLYNYIATSYREVVTTLEKGKELNEKTEKALKEGIEKFIKTIK